MEIKLIDLLPIQEEVNKKVREKIDRELGAEDFILAFNVEYFEFLNEIGTWKWWKHNHKINKERILDELADLYAFFLSLMLSLTEEQVVEFEKELTRVSNQVVESTDKNDKMEIINGLITVVGTDNEAEHAIQTVNRFGIAIGIARILFDGITYEEIIHAYKEKSKVNIERQTKNY